MNDPVLKLRVLARTEMVLARILARRTANRLLLSVIALVFILLALAMLNLAGYLALAGRFSPPLAGFLVALFDLAAAGGALILAGHSRGRDSEEEKMAREIRDLAYYELNTDVEILKTELAGLGNDVRRIRNGFISFTDTTANLVLLLNMLTRAIRKKGSSEEMANAETRSEEQEP